MRKVYLGSEDISQSLRMNNKPVFIQYDEPFAVEYLVVAGGGGAGYTQFGADRSSGTLGGGGGAGGLRSGSIDVNINDTFSATVGSGGSGGSSGVNASNGQNSSLIGSTLSITSIGGGKGGQISDEDGGNGGSGGGTAYAPSSAVPGTGTAGQGYDGSTGYNITNFHTGGCGGGAGSAPPNQYTAGAGASWLDGVTYATGGKGSYAGGGNNSAGSGGDAGLSGATGGSGINGIIKLRYLGLPKATGGTITQSGGYTYHTFNTTGTFTIISTIDT